MPPPTIAPCMVVPTPSPGQAARTQNAVRILTAHMLHASCTYQAQLTKKTWASVSSSTEPQVWSSTDSLQQEGSAVLLTHFKQKRISYVKRSLTHREQQHPSIVKRTVNCKSYRFHGLPVRTADSRWDVPSSRPSGATGVVGALQTPTQISCLCCPW